MVCGAHDMWLSWCTSAHDMRCSWYVVLMRPWLMVCGAHGMWCLHEVLAHGMCSSQHCKTPQGCIFV